MTPLLLLHAVCPLLFFTDLTRNPYATQIVLLQAGLFLVLSARLAGGFRTGTLTVRRTLLDVPILAGWAVALASWGASWLAHPAFRASVFYEGFRNQLFLVVNLLLPFFLAVQVPDEAWERRFRRTVLAVGALAAAYGVLQYFGVEWFWPKSLNPYNGRPVSTFGNPNFLSSYLVMLLPFCLWELVRSRAAARTGWGALLLLYVAALICTMTRSSWIGSLAAVGISAWADRRAWARQVKPLAVLGVLTAAMALFWPGSPLAQGAQGPIQRAAELFRGVAGKGVYGSWHQRLLIWHCAWDMARERPFLGKGWGCFELFFPFYQGGYLLDPVLRGFRTHANNAHNILMEVVSQTGLAGVGAVLWILFLAAAFLLRKSTGLSEDRRGLAWAKAAAVAGMLADNFFGNVSLFFAVPAFLFAWTAGSLAADAAGGEKSFQVRRPLPALLVSALLIASLGGALWEFRAWRADVDYFDGFKRVQRGDVAGAIRAFESSRGWRRREVNNAYELGNAYLRQAREGLSQGLTEEPKSLFAAAAGAYDDALAANAGYDEIHFNRSSALLPLGRREEALSELRLALLINPLHEDSYRVLGDLYARDPSAAAAETDLFRRAVLYFPRSKTYWNALGHGLSRSGKPAEAADAFARALALDVDFKVAEQNLRVSLAEAGLPPPPILAAPALAARVRISARARRWTEARASAESLASLAPECSLAWLMAGDLRAQGGDAAAAVEAYDRVLSVEPGADPARTNRARMLLRLGRREEARAALEEVLRDKPGDEDAAALLRSASAQSRP